MRTFFVFQPHSIVDIITNSSSELFVFKSKSREALTELISEVHPDYQEEYYDLVNITELKIEELNEFLCFHCGYSHDRREDYRPIGDYTFDELYEIEPDRAGRRGRISYRLKDNTKEPKEKKVQKFDDFHKDVDPYDEENWNGEDEWDDDDDDWGRSFVTRKNRMEVINRIDPKHQMYFMYSIEDNPNWEYQKKLVGIGGNRYHMG